ncbi:MAG: transposase [Acidobacteria bacterium]|nr:transposase [Acidobacteriota bacterium]
MRGSHEISNHYFAIYYTKETIKTENMRALELTQPYEIKDLERLCEQATNQRTRQRLQAICLRAQGKTLQEIAHLLNCSPKTIRTWIKLFNAGGSEQLEYQHTGGRTSKLSPEQENRLRLYLSEPSPNGHRWTLKALANQLFEDYGIHLSQQQVSQRLRRYGLSPSPAKKTKSHR